MHDLQKMAKEAYELSNWNSVLDQTRKLCLASGKVDDKAVVQAAAANTNLNGRETWALDHRLFKKHDLRRETEGCKVERNGYQCERSGFQPSSGKGINIERKRLIEV